MERAPEVGAGDEAAAEAEAPADLADEAPAEALAESEAEAPALKERHEAEERFRTGAVRDLDEEHSRRGSAEGGEGGRLNGGGRFDRDG